MTPGNPVPRDQGAGAGPAARECAQRAQADAPARRRETRVLLIIGGGIAAYKSLDLIRRLRERGVAVRCIMTAAARQFVTPLSAGALSGERVFTDLFDAETEFDVGHIRLARDADLIVVAPATADLMAKMAGGHADDLASAVLLADRSAGADRAGDEPADVEPSGDPAQPGAARGGRHRDCRSERR